MGLKQFHFNFLDIICNQITMGKTKIFNNTNKMNYRILIKVFLDIICSQITVGKTKFSIMRIKGVVKF